MAECYDSGDEPSGSIKCGEFFDKLRTVNLFRKDCAAWSQSVINGPYSVALQSLCFPYISDECLVSYLCFICVLESHSKLPVIIFAYRIVSFRKGHCATSRKAADSIPGSVIGTFHWRNPSGRTMASNINEYQEYFLEGKGGRT